MAARRIRKLQRHTDLYGSAHWATLAKVQGTGLVAQERGVYVGAWRDPATSRTKYSRDPSATHCLAFMPTGSGKTVGLAIPTMLSDYEVQDVQNIVELIADEGEKPIRGDNRFWIQMAKRLLLALSLHVKHDDDPRNDSLPGVSAALADPRYEDFDQLFEHVRSFPHDSAHSHGWIDADGHPTATHPLVAQIATQMMAMEARVKANIVAEAQSVLTLYSDPVIGANIAHSDFELAELRNGGITLYLVVQPAHKKRLRPLTRIILTQILLALMDSHKHTSEPKVLVMLEEVAELGALDVVATALGLGRGVRNQTLSYRPGPQSTQNGLGQQEQDAHRKLRDPIPRAEGWAPGRYSLSAGEVWLYAPNPRSWDSRYWGAGGHVRRPGLSGSAPHGPDGVPLYERRARLRCGALRWPRILDRLKVRIGHVA